MIKHINTIKNILFYFILACGAIIFFQQNKWHPMSKTSVRDFFLLGDSGQTALGKGPRKKGKLFPNWVGGLTPKFTFNKIYFLSNRQQIKNRLMHQMQRKKTLPLDLGGVNNSYFWLVSSLR